MDLTHDLQELSDTFPPMGPHPGRAPSEMVSRHPVRIPEALHQLEVFSNPMLPKGLRHQPGGQFSPSRRKCHRRNLWIEYAEAPEGLTIAFNINVGIPPTDKERIFYRGYGKNTGLGLFLVREVLKLTNISIIENGSEGQGRF